MSPSAGANRAAGRMLLQRSSRALPIPSRTGQLLPGDHRRPRETETGNIVRRSVERKLGWLGRWRRLARDYEELPEVSEAMVTVAMIRLMLHRLAHPRRKRLPAP
jgi:transposase